MNCASKLTRPGAPPLLKVEADFKYNESIKAQGGVWSPTQRCWLLPYKSEVWQALSIAVPLVADDDIKADLSAEKTQVPRVSPEALEVLFAEMPLKAGVKPYDHQLSAYIQALMTFGFLEYFEEERHGYRSYF